MKARDIWQKAVFTSTPDKAFIIDDCERCLFMVPKADNKRMVNPSCHLHSTEEIVDMSLGNYLNHLRNEVHFIARRKGWHEEGRTVGDYIALMHSELSEALEQHREGRTPTEIYYLFEGQYKGAIKDERSYPEIITKTEGGDSITEYGKPEGIPAELADVIIRILDFCGEHGIDIQKAVDHKVRYNKTRPHRHGGKVI